MYLFKEYKVVQTAAINPVYCSISGATSYGASQNRIFIWQLLVLNDKKVICVYMKNEELVEFNMNVLHRHLS